MKLKVHYSEKAGHLIAKSGNVLCKKQEWWFVSDDVRKITCKACLKLLKRK